MKIETKKITEKDLEIVDATIKIKAVIIDGKTINLTPMNCSHIENHITHKICDCGEEFEKKYTYQKLCANCESKRNSEKYNNLKLVEWDETTPLSLYEDDKYFFDEESIVEYCDENEVELADLKLVLCSKTSFSPVELDYICQDGEVVHEDWEPSKEFEDKLKEFNNWLVKTDTNTWIPTNFRVNLNTK